MSEPYLNDPFAGERLLETAFQPRQAPIRADRSPATAD